MFCVIRNKYSWSVPYYTPNIHSIIQCLTIPLPTIRKYALCDGSLYGYVIETVGVRTVPP